MKKKLAIILLAIFTLSTISSVPLYADDLPTEENIPNESPTGEAVENTEEIKDESKNGINIIDKIIETPASVTGEKYQGSGTVVDFTTTGSRAFYTIRAIDNSTYYLVIDLDKTENNVYFLSEINGEELKLSDITTTPQNQEQTNEPVQEMNSPNSSGDFLFYLTLVVMVSVLLVVGFHKKVKKNNPNAKFFDTVKSIFGIKNKEVVDSSTINNGQKNDDVDYNDEFDDEFEIDYDE